MVDWNRDIAGDLLGAWQSFTDQQAHLFNDDSDETAVSGAFAPFLKMLCRDGLLINTEYDKMNDYIQGRVEKALSLGDDIDRVKPDIIIHQPYDDTPNGNLLVIEMKKWGNSDWRHDEDKLIEMTSKPNGPRDFQYRYGLLLRFRQNKEIGEAILFQQGDSSYLDPKTLRM